MTIDELIKKLSLLRADANSIKWWALAVQETLTPEQWAALKPVLEEANEACLATQGPISDAMEVAHKIREC